MGLLMMILYLAIFLGQIALIFKIISNSNRENERKYWLWLFSLEVGGIVLAVIFSILFTSIIATGSMAGIFFFSKVAFSTIAGWVYGFMLVASIVLAILRKL